jgi:hypothetical protein
MPMLEHQLAPLNWSQLLLVRASPLRVVRASPLGWFLEECGDYKSVGAGVWTLDEAFHQLQMQV